MRGDARSTMLFALASLTLLASTACVTGAPDPLARGADSPAPLPEIKSAAPNPAMIWIPGAWHRDGVTEVWIPGHWAAPPPVP